MVKERALFHCVACMADRETVFDHVFTLGDFARSELVAGRNVGHKCYVVTVDVDSRACRERADCDCDVVGGIDFKKVLHPG